jgi:hypothetical protein
MKLKKRLGVVMILAMLVSMFAMTLTANAAKLNKKKTTVAIGSTVKLQVTGTSKKAKWSSSNKSVATVSKKGVVKGKKAGTAKITATVGKKKFTCKVTVKKPTLEFPNKETELGLGNGALVADTTKYGDYSPYTLDLNGLLKKSPVNTQVKWGSSNTSIATVKDGIVTGVQDGTVRITARAKGTNVKASIVVTIVAMGQENEKYVGLTQFNFDKYFEKVVYTVYRKNDKDANIWDSGDSGQPTKLEKFEYTESGEEKETGEYDYFDGMEVHVAYVLKNPGSFDMTKSRLYSLTTRALRTPYYVTLNGTGYTQGAQVEDETATARSYDFNVMNNELLKDTYGYGTDKDKKVMYATYSSNVAGQTLYGFDRKVAFTWSYPKWDDTVVPAKWVGNVTRMDILGDNMTITEVSGQLYYK